MDTGPTRSPPGTNHPPRPEDELSASGVTWDILNHECVSEDTVRGGVPPALGREEATARDRTSSSVLTAVDVEVGDEGAASSQKEKIVLEEDTIWVEWEHEDPQNPYHFGARKKWITCWICCVFTGVCAMSGTSISSGNASLMAGLNCSRELAALSLGAFPLGFAIAPLVLAPYSEAYGRYPMYVSTSIIYVLFLIPIARAQNIATVVICRLIAGLAASTGSTLVGGTIADLFESKDRGRPMSLFSFFAFVGTGAGPAIMGYVAQNLGWRWIQYLNIIFGSVMALALTLFTTETRGSVILSRRANGLRKETNDPRYQCRADAERASILVLIKVSLTRPIYLLFTEPIVAAFSLWIGFCWGALFLSLEAVGLVFSTVYGFSVGEVGLVFLSVIVSSVLGFGTSIYQDRLYRKYVGTRGPEARLYTSCVGGLMFSGGLIMFAFTQGRGHWMGPVISLVFVFWGIYAIYLATFNYLADVYHIYASSALSGQSLCRNIAGSMFPLFTFQMYDGLGYTWASFLAGGLALLLAVIPFVLLAKGRQIRAKSKFAMQLTKMLEEVVPSPSEKGEKEQDV